MSSNAKRVQEINLEDFERRLRAAGSAQGAIEDPLEELTRLVNTIAAERPQAEERVVEFPPQRQPRAALPPAPQIAEQPEFAPPPQPSPVARQAPAEPEAPLLRASYDESERDFAVEAEAPIEAETLEVEPRPIVADARPPRPASWYLKVGGLVGVALIAAPIAAYWNMHGSSLTGSRTPPMILAADGPSKVAPPDEKTVQSPSDTGALLNKDSLGSGQVKVTSNQEQPIDMTLKGDSPVALTKDTPIIAPSMAAAMVAPSTPTAADAPAEPNPPAAAPPAAVKKGPKTVSVRPDGTLITADAMPAATAPSPSPIVAPRKVDAAPSVTSQASSPTLDLPAKPTPAKTTARVNVSKTDTTAPTEPVNAPLQLGSGAAAEKPAKLPTKLRPQQEAANSAQATAAPAASGGDWSVQLAAPRSEADAQSAIQKLQTKFGSALGDNELGVHKAEVNGETIYRVRAGGLSKSEAVSLCQRLKGDGGDCFVAKN